MSSIVKNIFTNQRKRKVEKRVVEESTALYKEEIEKKLPKLKTTLKK